jgi:hypothetical protein
MSPVPPYAQLRGKPDGETFLRSMAGHRFEIVSAGTEATGVHPLALRVTAEGGWPTGCRWLADSADRIVAIADGVLVCDAPSGEFTEDGVAWRLEFARRFRPRCS